MKKSVLASLIIIIFLSSCNKWTGSYGGNAMGCTAFHPKKFNPNPKPIRHVKGPRPAF